MEILGIIWLPTWLLLFIILVVTYSVYMCKDYYIFKSLGIPGPTPLPIIGNFIPYFKLGVKDAMTEWYKKYGRVFGVFEMNVPTIFVGDPEMLKEICVKQFHNFTNRRILVKQRPPMDKLLNNLSDGHWKHVRNTITPTFSSGKLKMMTNLINSACDKFVANLLKSAEKKEDVEIKQACGAFSIDVIASTLFGIQIDSQLNPDDPFVKHGKSFFKVNALTVAIMVFAPILVPLLSFIPSRFKDAMLFFRNVVEETFSQRQAGSEKRNDFLQLMVNASHQAEEADAESKSKPEFSGANGEVVRKGLTTDEILGQALIFFFGGYETTGSSLAMLFYSLALHPDVLEKTQLEIDRVLGKDDVITYEQIGQLHYLEQVLSESQRVYPAASRVDRICSATTTIKGITIPKGMVVTMPIEAIHHDEEFWPDPERFDPDRFRADVKGDIDPFTFLPFGHGPRNCIAMRLALVEMKMAAARVLQKLRPVKVSRTQENPRFSKIGFLAIQGGSWIGMEKRD